ncbi:SixA phosphatase family protein [Pseudidiomarina sp. E22-M8]|uniref:SixA phosphatase family protein n=1 Tax=Pseudidiomarina sp. E22-M8 TaxID=3424768 RepID=UPI00403D0B3C
MAQDFSIIVVRHAEKAVAESDPPLSEKGQCRAQALAELLSKVKISAIYSTAYKRTEQTVQPLAEQLGLEVETYGAGGGANLAGQLRDAQQTVLVVGHSNTVPAIVRALKVEVEDLTEQDYGDVFLVQFREGKPQLLRLMIPLPD